MDTEIIAFDDADQWESWLADKHELRSDVWVKLAKKNSGIPSVSNVEALDVALCYGWIDSQRKAYDDQYFLQRYSRRRPKGSWSKVNVGKVEALMAAGRMQPAGLAEVLAAQADGRWDAAYESQRNATVPPDLATGLAQNQQAGSAFAALDKTNQYLLILRLLKAKTPQTRAAQLKKVLAELGDAPSATRHPEHRS